MEACATGDRLAFIQAIRESPEDDTLRMVYADWLDEHGGNPELAEFIRKQIELARLMDDWPHHKGRKVWHDKRAALEVQTKMLLRSHEARWRRGPACERCAWSGRVNSDKPFRYTEPCPACAGTGWTGPLGEKVLPDGHMMPRAWRVPAEFRRGFIAAVSTPLADVFAGDDVTEWAVRVARWPCVALEEWGLTDREPALLTAAQYPWLWQWHPDRDDAHRLPRKVILAMYALKMHRDYLHTAAFRTTNLYFDTPDAARLALARSVAQVVNEAAHD
jgi:uncharacterized protein (TIGR02996 family)